MKPYHRNIVVLGASAGGVEALQTLFASLPPNLDAAFFVVLHVWPGGKSFLPEILRRVTAMPVEHAVDGDVFSMGRVYIAPPDLHLMIEDGRVQVIRGPRENRCRPAVNPLFRSAATSYGQRVIGVVLTGTLDDGSSGLWAIKKAGGVAIVQDPTDAAYQDMPQSALDAVEPDYCVPLAEIAVCIAHCVREPIVPQPQRELPQSVQIINGSMKLKPAEMEIDKFANRSVFSCPECNGALWEVTEGNQVTYTCHVGHSFSSKSLRIEQDYVLEESLWSALRALVESAALDERLAAQAAESGLEDASRSYRKNAEEKRMQEKHVREFLNNIKPTPPTPPTI